MLCLHAIARPCYWAIGNDTSEPAPIARPPQKKTKETMLRISNAHLALIAALLLATPAFAHAKLVASTPSDGAILAVPISRIEFVFSKILRLTNVRVTRQNDSKDIPLAGDLPVEASDRISVAVAPLPSGNYAVNWTGVSRDGHIMKGAFSFSVATAEAPKPAQ